MRAFIFPGQGSQAVGMGKALADASAAAREVFQEVDDALEQNLFKVMTQGPDTELTLTENAQPAIMANAIATLRVLEKEAGFSVPDKAAFVAGHSLGEYTALCAAKSLDLSTTARLLKIRGKAMQAAVPVGQGAMAALLGIEFDDADAVARDAAQGDVCSLANDNAPGQIVISGHRDAVDRAIALTKERGKKAMLLPVSAPFHCSLMEPAAHAMEKALAEVSIQGPLVPIYANVIAAAVDDPETIARLLIDQVTGLVRWRESVLAMELSGVTQFVEFGAKVLGPMVKRIANEAQPTSLVSMADIEAFAASA